MTRAAGTEPIVDIGPGELVSWAAISVAVHALQACWRQALCADAAVVAAGSGDFTQLLASTTQQLLTLLHHRFHDALLSKDSLDDLLACVLLQEVGQSRCKDLNLHPAIFVGDMLSHGAGCNRSGGTPATGEIPEGTDRERIARGWDAVSSLLGSGVLSELDSLGRLAGMPDCIAREVTACQARALFWVRAALVSLCSLGPGPAQWKDSLAARALAVGGHPPPTRTACAAHGSVREGAPMFEPLDASQPLFERLFGIHSHAPTPTPTSSSPPPVVPSSPPIGSEPGRTPLPHQAWCDTCDLLCEMLRHASLSVSSSLDGPTSNTNASGGTSSSAVRLARLYAKLSPSQRLEVACADSVTRQARVGCCNLVCASLDPKHVHGEAGVALLRCSKCEAVSYCCRACQKEAWGSHKDVCAVLVSSKLFHTTG
ncbi:MAG: hypothetical protein WDW36_009268 [Sanguina aurantia]